MPVASYLNDFTGTVSLTKSLRDKANDQNAGIPDDERHLLYEAVFVRLFRAYENMIEEIFLSYLLEEPTVSNKPVKSHVKPKDRDHAREIVTSSQAFLDWTSPDTVITRCEIYLDDVVIRDAITASTQHLKWAKSIRNHVAHNSKESGRVFQKVVTDFYLTTPVSLPSAGEFLAAKRPTGPARADPDILTFFIDRLSSTATAIAG